LGSFGHLAVLAVGFGASLAGEVSAAIFYRAKASKGSLRRTNFKKTYGKTLFPAELDSIY
jgi:hypothetical protein